VFIEDDASQCLLHKYKNDGLLTNLYIYRHHGTCKDKYKVISEERKCHIFLINVKVKVLPLQATKALRAGRGIALPFFKTLALKMGVGASAPHPGRFTPGKDPVTIVQEAA
jgi:hypothetical protein